MSKKNPNLLLDKLKELFDLRHDTDEEGTVEGIQKSISFNGANLWSLIFAIFIASIGLNVNSTAVIIGAMLISPLMGPILGIGLAAGINDLELLKRSGKNLFIATIFATLTSYLYFSLTPLSEAQSELLARTQPTIFDVLIAIFGGATGIVAGSRKDKTNALPGVAIATALMPPLCTAGFGLATGNLSFFLGAFYLYLINCIFIAWTTLVFVRYLHFKKKTFLDKEQEKKVKLYILVFIIISIIPSLYSAFLVVNKTLYNARANKYIQENLVFTDSKVINTKINYTPPESSIEVTLIGNPLDTKIVKDLESKMIFYKLENTNLFIYQNKKDEAIYREFDQFSENLKIDIIKDLYQKNQSELNDKNQIIQELKAEITKTKKELADRIKKSKDISVSTIIKEIKVEHPNISEISFSEIKKSQANKPNEIKTVPTFIIKWKTKVFINEKQRLEAFLKVRTEKNNLEFIHF